MMVMMMMMMMITSVCADAQDHAGPHGEGPCAEDLSLRDPELTN